MAERDPNSPVALPRKRHGILVQAIQRWRQTGVIDDRTAETLTESIVVASFDWQRTGRYAFIVSIFCFVIAIGTIMADDVFMKLLARIFDAPAIVKCGVFAGVSSGIFRYGLLLRKQQRHRVYGSESVLFLGALALGASAFFLGVAIDTGTGTGHYSVVFLIASALYALLGLWFPSTLVWVFGLLSLGAWMGTETGYVSGHGMYFLGMNYPLRFVIFGAALTALGIGGQHLFVDSFPSSSTFKNRFLSFSPQTKEIGLLNLFVALWIMSIFGNYGDMTEWRDVRQYELLHWSLLFGAVAIAAVWYGLKRDDRAARGFGLTFLFINLYTRFFEYFWDSIHKAAFFAVLAASFWYLGRRAETIWHFGHRGQESDKDVEPTPNNGRG